MKVEQHTENIFIELGLIGLLTICADCQSKKIIKILNFVDNCKTKGVSHGMCEPCFDKRMVKV